MEQKKRSAEEKKTADAAKKKADAEERKRKDKEKRKVDIKRKTKAIETISGITTMTKLRIFKAKNPDLAKDPLIK